MIRFKKVLMSGLNWYRLKASIETGEKPKAEITLSVDGEEKHAYAEGGGPVDATFKAIESIDRKRL